MNSTPRTPEHKFPLGSGPSAMNNKTLYLTLVASACLGFLFILALYGLRAPNPVSSRVAFGIFVSVLPALGTFLVLKITRLLVSWRGAVVIYVVLFALLTIIQAVGRKITIYS